MRAAVLLAILAATACSSGERKGADITAPKKEADEQAYRECVKDVGRGGLKDPAKVCDCVFDEENRDRTGEEIMRKCLIGET